MNLSVEEILSPQAVRKTTALVFQLAEKGESHFHLHLDHMPKVADIVVQIIRENYPDIKIPYHSRWGHFRAGSSGRLQLLMKKLKIYDPTEGARRLLDLVIPSVLLDAGAGAQWVFKEPGREFSIGRSEGLGIASFYMFLKGDFSSSSSDFLRSDAEKLKAIDATIVANGFQVSDNNPLIGLEGRAGLVRSLGKAIEEHPDIFKGERPGGLVDYFQQKFGRTLPADEILKTLLYGLASIWPGRLQMDGQPLGDVWEHPKVGKVAFHKLSQWLTYSLLEPLEEAGFQITQMQELTGLAEYRNGGLFVDAGVLQLKQTTDQAFSPDDPVIVEWRALTVQLLDLIAPMIRERLNVSEVEFPLAKILEGGTWWAGRHLAKKLRNDGSPPLKVLSDGTVF